MFNAEDNKQTLPFNEIIFNVVPPKRSLMKGGDGRIPVKYVHCDFRTKPCKYILIDVTAAHK